ncbi:MAG TPA: galactose oxidase-like domain-containing protein [Candidatus Angelobacter sp.]|nr:galactose oxidase-like domain-containing protein [Candidatus Angelobacter sp.]
MRTACNSGTFYRGVSHTHPTALNAALRRWRAPGLLLAALLVGGCFQSLARAQEPQKQEEKKPFIEPAEMAHEKAAVRAFIEASPHLNGKWETLPFMMPINPVHVALMHSGKVLVISGSGNEPSNKILEAGVWNPGADTVRTFRIDWDMFCNGMVILPDGRPFVLGGTLQYDPFFGEPKTAAFDVATEKFVSMPHMSGGRWYPTGTVLGDGSVLVEAGLTNTSSVMNKTVQIFKAGSWTAAGTIFNGVPLYPRQHVLPDGKVFEDGANPDSQMFDPVAHTWTFVANTIFGQSRDYGTSVLLPLTPANGHKPKVMIMGGGSPNATNTTELIDLSVPHPKWVSGPNMSNARIQVNATILPNGKVLVSGGSAVDEDVTTASLPAQLYDPATDKFSSASTMEFPRVYHSNTLLLPDATVLAVGGNPARGTYEPHIEIYSPPYLFTATGAAAPRPSITNAPPTIRYGAVFQVQTPEAAKIKSIALMRAGSVTHSFDMDQRMVGLTFTTAAGVLHVTAPSKGDIAPPGYYMLFILNSEGVPSVARFVHVGL